ncbi:unnamed protein product [Effrenium voratum]|uniref:Uncharacterized protein n=1 Tax=Effrenium voratum TaxID=2562239 RepID=A0AA36MU10_9DINO|nr:unnamed protein product [Effrenium voratum]
MDWALGARGEVLMEPKRDAWSGAEARRCLDCRACTRRIAFWPEQLRCLPTAGLIIYLCGEAQAEAQAMGCAATRVGPLEPSVVVPGHTLIRQDKGQRVCEASIDFKEPSLSFDSMTHQITRQDTILPPVAAMHDRHVAKLERFLEALPDNENVLSRLCSVAFQVNQGVLVRTGSDWLAAVLNIVNGSLSLEGDSAPCVLSRKDSFGQRVREPAIAFTERAQSFDSMSHKLTRRDYGCPLPPVADTHFRHVARTVPTQEGGGRRLWQAEDLPGNLIDEDLSPLEKFLNAVPSNSGALKREVEIRRSRLSLDSAGR